MPTPPLVGKQDVKNVALASMVTPEVITDLFRANGAVFLLNKLGIINDTLVGEFEECFEKLRTEIVGFKGIVNR